MNNEIQLINELILITEKCNENLNFELELKDLKTQVSIIDIIKLSEKEFKLMNIQDSNSTTCYISSIIKLKKKSTLEFNRFTLTSYLKSIE